MKDTVSPTRKPTGIGIGSSSWCDQLLVVVQVKEMTDGAWTNQLLLEVVSGQR